MYLSSNAYACQLYAASYNGARAHNVSSDSRTEAPGQFSKKGSLQLQLGEMQIPAHGASAHFDQAALRAVKTQHVIDPCTPTSAVLLAIEIDEVESQPTLNVRRGKVQISLNPYSAEVELIGAESVQHR
jgi:hypothetical protein